MEAIGIQVVIATNVSLLSYKKLVSSIRSCPSFYLRRTSVSGAPGWAWAQSAEQPAGHRHTHKGSGAQISSRKKPLNSWGLRLGSWCGAVAMASMAFL